jgi:hypothetical protein
VVALAKDVAAALARWLRRVDSVTPLGGGWNSSTWLVAAGDERYVAKLVDHLDAQGLDAGLRLAEFATAWGLPCGAPVRTRGGELTIGLSGDLFRLAHRARHRPRARPTERQPRRPGHRLRGDDRWILLEGLNSRGLPA